MCVGPSAQLNIHRCMTVLLSFQVYIMCFSIILFFYTASSRCLIWQNSHIFFHWKPRSSIVQYMEYIRTYYVWMHVWIHNRRAFFNAVKSNWKLICETTKHCFTVACVILYDAMYDKHDSIIKNTKNLMAMYIKRGAAV